MNCKHILEGTDFPGNSVLISEIIESVLEFKDTAQAHYWVDFTIYEEFSQNDESK